MNKMLDLLMGLGGAEVKDPILKPPFGYPGGKSKSVEKILPHLPHSECYVEVFGGSAAVMLSKRPTKLDVYNDRYAGVVAFYQCMRCPAKMAKLMDWLQNTVHAREEWLICRETWENCDDPVERAARWYYMTAYSFGAQGRHFGSDARAPNSVSGKIFGNMDRFPAIHSRFKRVLVENQDCIDCITKFDTPDTVFYLDPPYIATSGGMYKHEMSHEAHRRLIDKIFDSEGTFVVSGYSNPVYENQDWDDRIEWSQTIARDAMVGSAPDREYLQGGPIECGTTVEVLWTKGAR